MSSILNALRKAEENQAQPTGSDSWSHEFDTAKALRKEARRSWRIRTGIVFLFGIVLVAGGVWVLYDQRSVIGRWASGDSLVTSSVPDSRDREDVASSSHEQIQADPSGLSDGEPAPKAPILANSPLAVEKAAVEPSPSPAERRPEPAPVETATPAVAEEEPQGRDIDLDQYRLEAIVWSDNPDSRFAVINGRIVRAGAELDGVSVTAIERNGVKMRSGKAMAELRFTRD